MPQGPADAGVYHHAQTVIADVTLATSRKADRHMADASAVARLAAQLAVRLLSYMKNAEPVAEMSGARAARVRHSFAVLLDGPHALESLPKPLAQFIKEHGASFDGNPDEVMGVVVSFIEWAKDRLAQLDARVRAFRTDYAKALEEDRDRLRELSEQWSAVDGDGLS